MSDIYDKKFYSRIAPGSHKSANCIVPIVMTMAHPNSVIDFGCGTGSWLRAFREIGGIEDLHGMDFGQVDGTQLEIKPEQFQQIDLTQPLNIGRRFDLAITLEVAEHLPPEASAQFVENITRHADVVLFSAAIPGQQGDNHINCHYPSYWAKHFATHNFLCFDPIRPQVWHNSDIEPWYRQNALMFIREERIPDFPFIAAHPPTILDLVNPDFFEQRLNEQYQTQKMQVKRAKQSVWRKVKTSGNYLK